MVLLEAGKLPHRRFLSIWKLPELRGIEATPEHLTLGALTTYTDVRRSEVLSREFPLLCRAAAETGSVATQNRGTLGGNIANASPAADSPPALLVYDAELELVSANGSRWVPYHGFWTGYKQIALKANELIRRIRLPRPTQSWRHYYRKVGTRRAQAISKVCLAAAARIDGTRIADVRIALGSIAPTVLRATETENILRAEKPDAGNPARSPRFSSTRDCSDRRHALHRTLPPPRGAKPSRRILRNVIRVTRTRHAHASQQCLQSPGRRRSRRSRPPRAHPRRRTPRLDSHPQRNHRESLGLRRHSQGLVRVRSRNRRRFRRNAGHRGHTRPHQRPWPHRVGRFLDRHASRRGRWRHHLDRDAAEQHPRRNHGRRLSRKTRSHRREVVGRYRILGRRRAWQCGGTAAVVGCGHLRLQMFPRSQRRPGVWARRRIGFARGPPGTRLDGSPLARPRGIAGPHRGRPSAPRARKSTAPIYGVAGFPAPRIRRPGHFAAPAARVATLTRTSISCTSRPRTPSPRYPAKNPRQRMSPWRRVPTI